MVMTQARLPAHTPAKKAAARKMGVRPRDAVQPDFIVVEPGKVGSPDVAHVFQLAIGKSGKEVEAKLVEALKESKNNELRLKFFKADKSEVK